MIDGRIHPPPFLSVCFYRNIQTKERLVKNEIDGNHTGKIFDYGPQDAKQKGRSYQDHRKC